MFPSTIDRVPVNTDEQVNCQIRQQTDRRVQAISAAGDAAIERRLRELDEEWDIERYLETMAPSMTLLGITLGLTRHRGWFLLPLVVQTFFLQHALAKVRLSPAVRGQSRRSSLPAIPVG